MWQVIAAAGIEAANRGIAGLANYLAARKQKRLLEKMYIPGREYQKQAGALLGQELAGKAVGAKEIAPQISAVKSQAATTQRALMEGLGMNPNITQGQIEQSVRQTTNAEIANLRQVYAEQARQNLGYRQQALGQVLAAGQTERQRQLALAQAGTAETTGLLSGLTGMGETAGKALATQYMEEQNKELIKQILGNKLKRRKG